MREVRGQIAVARQKEVLRLEVSMNEACPACGLKFEREPGYFVAAMYLSYGAAVAVISDLMKCGNIEGRVGEFLAQLKEA